MSEFTQAHVTSHLPGGVGEADEDLLMGVHMPGVAPNENASRRFDTRGNQDWSQINSSGQTGIVVRNTFIDVCPLEEESGSENEPCNSPTHRRNLSAPPSPTRSRNPWAKEQDAQYIDSDQEEEEDPGSIPNYQWAPEGGLLKAQEQPCWPPSPGSPKKIAGRRRHMEADSSNPSFGDFLKGGMKLAGMHGLATERGGPPAQDPYDTYGLNPATGGLGSVFGQGSGLGVFGSASSTTGSLDRHGLSTVPPGYFGDGHMASVGSVQGLGVPGPNILTGFDAVGLGSLGHGLGGGSDPLLGLPSTGLGSYNGFGNLGRELPTPPQPAASLGLSSQVLSNERLATAPTLSTSPPPAPEAARPAPGNRRQGGNDQLAPGAAYISDNPPPRTPLAGRIPTEAPAYVLGTTSGTSAPLLSSSPPAIPMPASAEQAAGSRRPSFSAKGEGSRAGSKGGAVDLKGVFGGMAPPDAYGQPQPPAQELHLPRRGVPGGGAPGGGGGGPERGAPPPYPLLSSLAGPGDAADRYIPDGPTGPCPFMGVDVGGPPGPYGPLAPGHSAPLPPEAPPPAPAPSGPWTAGGSRQNTQGPWIAGGALRNLESLGDACGAVGRGAGAGKGRGGRVAGRGDPAAVAAAIAGEANSRVPLSGGGPKRTDYIKKYGGVPEGEGPAQVPITTMMLKNIPCRKSQDEVMMHIDQKGFANRYDFFYLPRDVKFRANLGYAFINFLTPEDASNFSAEMNGYRFSSSGSMKACAVVPAHVQGLMNNLAAFKRTEVMRSSRRPYFSSMTNL